MAKRKSAVAELKDEISDLKRRVTILEGNAPPEAGGPRPPMSVRERVNRIIRRIAYEKNIDHDKLWRYCYITLEKEMNINIYESARRLGIDRLDVVEQTCLMGRLHAICVGLLKHYNMKGE